MTGNPSVRAGEYFCLQACLSMMLPNFGIVRCVQIKATVYFSWQTSALYMLFHPSVKFCFLKIPAMTFACSTAFIEKKKHLQ